LTTAVNTIKPVQRDAIGVAFVLLSGLGVIFLPTTAKFAYIDGSNVLTVAVARGIIGLVLLALVAVAMDLSFRMPRDLLRSSMLAGVAQAFFVFGILAAITSINISLVLLILYLYPIVLAIHQHRRGTIRVHPAQWFCALVTACGLALILGVRFEEISLLGISLATMAMLATVVITITNHRVTETLGSLVSNFYMTAWSLLIFVLMLLLVGEFAQPRSTLGWVALVGNGVAYCIAWVAFFAGARILGATRASMLTLLEPAAAAFGAWVLFGETYTPLQWCGFFVVLAALFGFEKLSRAEL
jgi:drug/metabolite transporter (DMT)-like permease